jgi:hypothetical protein
MSMAAAVACNGTAVGRLSGGWGLGPCGGVWSPSWLVVVLGVRHHLRGWVAGRQVVARNVM